MLSVSFDTKSTYQLRWPTRDADIIRLGETYVAHEAVRPPEAQLLQPGFDLIEQALETARDAHNNAQAGEGNRAFAAEQFRQDMQTARTLSRDIMTQLKVIHRQNLAALEAWGFDTVTGKSGNILVHIPRRMIPFMSFLRRYIDKENTLPEAERIASPSLAEMQTLHASIIANFLSRDTATTQRRSAIADRNPAIDYLLTLLQVAAVNLVVLTYNGSLTPALAMWGYQVVERPPSPATPEPAAAQPVAEGSS